MIKKAKRAGAKPSTRQKGRQQGSQTMGEAHKSNSEQFHRHPGQGMRGKQGGAREAERAQSAESKGNDSRKHARPPQER